MKKPRLAAGESAVWQQTANRAQSGSRAVGGRLFLTDQRLMFEPNIFDRVTRGRPWAVQRSDILRVDLEGRSTSDLLSGGIRQRLNVSTRTGEELFVINKLNQVIPTLQEHLGLHSDPSEA